MPIVKDQIDNSSEVTDDMLDALFTQALQRHQQEDWQAAEDFYRKVLAAMPEQPNVNYNLGMLKLQCNQVNDSLTFFKNALSADPGEPKYWTSYVQALVQAGQKSQAVDILMKGIEKGLHGDEVNALVETLTKPALQKPSQAPLIIKNVAGQSNHGVVINQSPPINGGVVLSSQTNKKASKSKKPISFNRHLDNPRIKKVLALQESGKLQQANKEWLSLLKFYPNNPVIMTCLGSIALQQNRIEDSIDWLEKSIAIEPKQSTAFSYLSIAFVEQKKFNDAIRVADKAIKINPDYAEAYVNKGNALRALSRFEEAVKCYQQSFYLNPDNIDTKYNLGVAYSDLKQYRDSASYLKGTVTLQSNDKKSLSLYGEVLLNLKQYDEANKYLNASIDIDSTDVKTRFARGVVYMKLKQFKLALDDLTYVAQERPNFEQVYNNLGLTLRELGQYEKALAAFDDAIRLDSERGKILNNKGLLLVDLQRFDEALDCYEQALKAKPDNYDSYWNKSLLYLLKGDFNKGWPLYEYRWKSNVKESYRHFKQPLWLGEESIAGKTILIYPEQGFGDYIQFCRYIADIEKLGAQVILEVRAPLIPVIKTLKGAFTIVESGTVLQDFDYHCPIMSLPLAIKTQLDSIPANIPYLYADTEKANHWKKQLGNKIKPRVGLVWSGSVEHVNDHHRSMPLEKISPLFSLPYAFHALQNQISDDDLKFLQNDSLIQLHQAELNDFADTAALIEQMDLVITVDTSVAHLAGAMGKECWVLLAKAYDFRWLTNRTDSPWYPTMTLFKQPEFNDWDSVIQALKVKLDEYFK
ncbi:MAG: tetratricopeptide repeat protein [Methylophilaceae bacterium]